MSNRAIRLSTLLHGVSRTGAIDPEGHVRRRWPDWLPLLPAVLLTVVAAVQIHLVRSEHLDPWKGGGFGMFSTTEGGPHRHVHVYVSTAAGEERIDPPDALGDLEDRLRTLPTRTRMERFLRALAAAHPDRIVRVEIWQTDFDPETLRPSVAVVREMRHVPDDDEAS